MEKAELATSVLGFLWKKTYKVYKSLQIIQYCNRYNITLL